MTRALVLGGGGVVGIAWETGVLKGLRDGGIDPATADLIVGTSAGSIVGTQVRSGRSLDDLYADQLSPSDGQLQQAVGQDMEKLMAIFARWSQATEMTEALCAEIGAQALVAKTAPEEEWLHALGALLPDASAWPNGSLIVTAVDAESGVFRTWDRTTGVALTPAVASSCTVPGMFPPVTIEGRRYIDGGVRSGTNADLARGHDTVVLVAPIGGSATGIGGIARRQLDAEVEGLRAAGSAVEVILPDAHAQEAFGPNLMDPSRRGAAAEAGLRQGAEVATRIASRWQTTGSAAS
jgi:NTE family protein